MNIEFFGQPFSDERRIGHLLSKILPDARSVWIVCAWAQLSGVKHLKAALLQLRERGVNTEAIIGIDLGIATREALEEVLRLFQTVHVFHDPGERTFHPKLYCVETDDEILVLLGSSNLTEGGFFLNYEANVAIHLRRGERDDDSFYQQVCEYRDRLRDTGMPCRQLNTELLTQLSRDQSLIGGEAERAERRRKAAPANRLAREIFGETPNALPSAPPVPRAPRPPRVGTAQGGTEQGAARPRAVDSGGTVDETPTHRWWKQLTKSDVMRKPKRSHQRKYLILGQAGHSIDQKTWFRDDFFSSLDWHEAKMRTGNLKEVADVTCEVFIGEDFRGNFRIRIEHAPTRIADQNNSPTWLHWADLAGLISEEDYTGWYVLLERFNDSCYRLRLTPNEPS